MSSSVMKEGNLMEQLDTVSASTLGSVNDLRPVSQTEAESRPGDCETDSSASVSSGVTTASEPQTPGTANLTVTPNSSSVTSCCSSTEQCDCVPVSWLSLQNDKRKERTIRDAILAHFAHHGVPIRDVCDVQLAAPTCTTYAEHRKSESLKSAFGSPLSALRSEFIDDIGFVPRLLMAMCDFVKDHITTEYLFRKSGLHALHKKLRERIERAYCSGLVNTNNDSCLLQNVDDSHQVTVHDVTYLLKAFFGELREPLLTANFEPHFLKCIEHFQVRSQRVRAVLLLCWLLPRDHLATLTYFARLLADVASQCAANRMDAHSLATICAPKLIRLSDQLDSSTLHEQRILNLKIGVVQTLIENAHCVGTVPVCLLHYVPSPAPCSPAAKRLRTPETTDVSLANASRKRSGLHVSALQTPDVPSTPRELTGSKKRRSKSVHGFLANAFKLRKNKPTCDSVSRPRGATESLSLDVESRAAESTAVFDYSNLQIDCNTSDCQTGQIRVGKSCMPIPQLRKRKSDARLRDATSKAPPDVLALALAADAETTHDAETNAPRGSAMSTFKRRVFQQTLGSLRRDRSKLAAGTPGTDRTTANAKTADSPLASHASRARQRFECDLQNLSPIRLSPHRPVTRHLSALSSTSQAQNRASCCLSPDEFQLRTRSRSRSARQQSCAADNASDSAASLQRNTVSQLPCEAGAGEVSHLLTDVPGRCMDESYLSLPVQCIVSEDTSTLNSSTGSRKLRRGQPNALQNGLVYPSPARIASARRVDCVNASQPEDEKENVRLGSCSVATEECLNDSKRKAAVGDSQSPLANRNACPPKVKDAVLRFEELTARQLRSASSVNVPNAGSAGARLVAYRVTPLCVNSSLAVTETSI